MAEGYIYGTTSNELIDVRIAWSATPVAGTNTSKVTAKLEYKRKNTVTTTYGTGTFALNIDGKRFETVVYHSVHGHDWTTAIEAERIIDHNDDGTKSISLNSYGYISGTSLSSTKCSGTATLDRIPRESLIAPVSDVTLGNKCTVKWLPLSKNFTYKIVFLCGEWWYISDLIHPNTTSMYTYAEYVIPLEVANQFPNSKQAEMTVELYTYATTTGTNKIGTETSTTCKVTIPETSDTLPTVAMSLSPVSSLGSQFSGLYIQNKTKVQANFTGSVGKYGASIKSYSMKADGKSYGNPYQSDILSNYGTISVTGTATDSRGLSGTSTQNITVIPYAKPSLAPYTGESSIVCKRCDSTGNLTPSGTCLRIKAGRQYSKVVADGVQKNFCIMRFKYKTEGATSWISEATILAKDATADGVDAILTNVNLSPATTYIVQIEVADDVGESYSTLITIPTDNVTVHLREGGKAIGIGKYAEKDNIVDINELWEVNVRGTLKAKEINSVEEIQASAVNVSGTIQASEAIISGELQADEVNVSATLQADAIVSESLQAGHIAPIEAYDGKDFNTLIYKTGYYTSKSAPVGAGSTNHPINETGVLEVISGMYYTEANNSWWGFAYQTYRTYTGKVYMRSYYSTSGWGTWKQVTLT